jgi:hypothetical protein
MKLFLTRLCYFLFPLLAASYLFVWVYEGSQREAISNGSHEKLRKWNAIHDPDNNYDVIIIGSSRGSNAYNPLIIDSIAGTRSYNMTSGSQNAVESYYLLEEVFRYQKPKIVVYETFLPSFGENPDYYHVLSHAKFMSSEGRFNLIVQGFKTRGAVNYLIPILKYRTYLRKDLKNLFRPKVKDTNKVELLEGYYYTDKVVDSATIDHFEPIYSFENTLVSPDKAKKSIRRLAALCAKNNALFIAVRAPYPPTRLKISKTDTAYAFFNGTYKELQIPFYDFNYLSMYDYYDQDFTDYHHMNFSGATKVSNELGQIINDNLKRKRTKGIGNEK